MTRDPSTASLRADRRAVTPLIGIVLIFGIAIIAFAGYQAEVVPDQNSEVEFQHFEDVRNDMVDVRRAVLTAGETKTNISQLATVTLGTNYPARLFALNPPDPVGTLRTSEPYNITIQNESGSEIKLPTRFLQYQNRYNELEADSIWYENSVLYIDTRDNSGNLVILEDQNIEIGGETLRITALQNEFRETGTGRVTVELNPTRNATNKIPTGNLTISLPTRLNGSEYWGDDEYWGDAFESIYINTTEDVYESGVHELNLNVSSEDLKIDTVGIQEEPEANNSVGVPDTSPPESILNSDSVVYEEGSTAKLAAVNRSGSRTVELGPRGVSALGPPDADLNGDGLTELPYVEGGDLYTNDTNTTKKLVDSSDSRSPRTNKTILAVGTWQGSEPSVFYANENKDTIYRVTADGTVTNVKEPGDGVNGVIGTDDIDGDSSDELLFVDGSQSIRYIDDDGAVTNLNNAEVGSNNGLGAGAVVTLNGRTWVVFVDTSNKVALATDDGGNEKQTAGSATAAKSSPTAADVAGDGSPEIVYVDKSNNLKYIEDPLDGNKINFLRSEDGNKISAASDLGVVS